MLMVPHQVKKGPNYGITRARTVKGDGSIYGVINYYFPHYRHHKEGRRSSPNISSRRRLQMNIEVRQTHAAERRLQRYL